MLDAIAKNITKGFIQRAGFVLIDKVCGEGCESMRNFMSSNIDSGERRESGAVSVAISHALSIPECIVVVVVVVHVGFEHESLPIDGVAVEARPEEIVGLSAPQWASVATSSSCGLTLLQTLLASVKSTAVP